MFKFFTKDGTPAGESTPALCRAFAPGVDWEHYETFPWVRFELSNGLWVVFDPLPEPAPRRAPVVLF